MIAEDPEIRQLILELKGQFGQSQEVAMDDDFEPEMIPRARRMSVKRISQQAKEELAKQSVQDEVSLRRESMAQHVSTGMISVRVRVHGTACECRHDIQWNLQ